jgi:hypothetical protein
LEQFGSIWIIGLRGSIRRRDRAIILMARGAVMPVGFRGDDTRRDRRHSYQPERGLRMPTFTLVLIAILVTGGGGGPTITNQPGYLTIEECQTAARDFKEAAQLSSASLEAYCIRGPRR